MNRLIISIIVTLSAITIARCSAAGDKAAVNGEENDSKQTDNKKFKYSPMTLKNMDGTFGENQQNLKKKYR
ncbi:hypothetical protein [Peribacillus sp. NPDC097895]|uniref:hypothetical protein n=1 Tax=Peribacillus sp. NPDC097895 TaxID=3390619 RepID=UPI003D059BC6